MVDLKAICTPIVLSTRVDKNKWQPVSRVRFPLYSFLMYVHTERITRHKTHKPWPFAFVAAYNTIVCTLLKSCMAAFDQRLWGIKEASSKLKDNLQDWWVDISCLKVFQKDQFRCSWVHYFLTKYFMNLMDPEKSFSEIDSKQMIVVKVTGGLRRRGYPGSASFQIRFNLGLFLFIFILFSELTNGKYKNYRSN